MKLLTRAGGFAAALALVIASVPAATARVGGSPSPPSPLSTERGSAGIDSTYGSGVFGTWTVDRFGLPAYRYTIDEETAPEAAQAELGGSRDAWHQIGNDHIVADAFNHGFVQLWSQDRLYQWVNLYEPDASHFAGGYGYLNIDGRVSSTLYDDRPAGAPSERVFGVDYARRRTRLPEVDVDEVVYAPFGDDPVLLHDVVIRNRSPEPIDASWFEYWDVNPVVQAIIGRRYRGTTAPRYAPGLQALVVDQLPTDTDVDPLTIYAAALKGSVAGTETDTRAFFGEGGRARPDAVAEGRLGGSIAPPTSGVDAGRTMFAFESPVGIAPGESVRLRYAYGAAPAESIPGILARYRSGRPWSASGAAWAEWVPEASFDTPDGQWLARELQWSAAMLRSGTTFEETCGHHIISQGGYYQYGLGLQGAFRDPPALMLPMAYAEPELAREVLRYSAREQRAVTGVIPYTMGENCIRGELPSADLDFWLLLAAAEYGLATRDLGFFDEVVPFADAGSATVWKHLKLAYRHQETLVGRGPHGGYLTAATTGDWSDFSPQFMQMTESTLVVAQLAYAYPRLAELADARGDEAFARALRSDAAELLRTLDGEWTGKGWYSRGYSGIRRLGQGVLYSEPQPWALLAGAASPAQAEILVANIRRFLTGVGAPEAVGGPSPIGSAQSPADSDPEVTERPLPMFAEAGVLGSYGGGNATFFGGVWFALNGPLVWALGGLDGTVPAARELAWDELRRNTLANHAAVYPSHWDGVISVDDACWAWYSADPARCGDEALTEEQHYAGQIMNQPAWTLTAALKLAGFEPTAQGYRIAPHFPFEEFSLRFPVAGVALERARIRGYVRPEQDADLLMEVRLPPEARPGDVAVWAGATRLEHRLVGGSAVFVLPARAGIPADWAVTWGS